MLDTEHMLISDLHQRKSQAASYQVRSFLSKTPQQFMKLLCKTKVRYLTVSSLKYDQYK